MATTFLFLPACDYRPRPGYNNDPVTQVRVAALRWNNRDVTPPPICPLQVGPNPKKLIVIVRLPL
jgi:hypothetical protein